MAAAAFAARRLRRHLARVHDTLDTATACGAKVRAHLTSCGCQRLFLHLAVAVRPLRRSRQHRFSPTGCKFFLHQQARLSCVRARTTNLRCAALQGSLDCRSRTSTTILACTWLCFDPAVTVLVGTWS